MTLVASSFLLASCCRCPEPPRTGDDARPTEHQAAEMAVELTPAEWSTAENQILTSPCDLGDPPGEQGRIALTADRTYENEVHDCQRLVFREPAPRFGPLAAIYPLRPAMAYDERSDFDEWRAVANLRRWSSLDGTIEDYPELGIVENAACLWMRYEDGAWDAAIDSLPCLPVRPAPATRGSWQVVEHRHPQAPRSAYPRSARWGWDDEDGVHYIGVKCGPFWCSVGPDGFTPREPVVLSGDAQRSIPGWYDEQHLAVSGSPYVVPGPWGRIYPSRPHYALRNDSAALEELLNGGFTGAYMRILRHPTHGFGGYEEKFNMTVRDDTARAEIFVRVIAGGGPGGAFAEFRSSGKPAVDARNRFVPTVRHAANGSVRWRWQDTDETAWLSCRTGCCDIQQ